MKTEVRTRAVLPKNRPEGMSVETYHRLARSPQCANLLSGRCSEPCSPVDENGGYKVEFDHIIPRSAGGKSTADNFQLLCPRANRSKYTNPDPRYSELGWWDKPFDHTKLRPHQLNSAYNLVRKDYPDLFANPDDLMARVLLLAWGVGAGKTIGAVALIFAYNEVRNTYYKHARRAKKVLWLVPQRTLAESLYYEFANDLTEYKLVDQPPKVEMVDSANDWAADADVVIATQQSLWDAENRNLTQQMREEILSRFDVIVIDEAQFAVERYMDIVYLAPQALKIAITATPMDGSGTLLCEVDQGKHKDRFALLSSFGYEEGRAQQIFKELLPFERGLEESVYFPVNGGEADVLRNGAGSKDVDTSVDLNAFRPRAVIARAIDAARRESRGFDYDCHVMVRFDSVAHAENWKKQLENDPDVASFGVSIVSAGRAGPQLGSSKHPWMMVKGNDGKVVEGSTRIVFTVDIGQFGINNRYCGVVAWVNPNASKIEVVQRIGRAIRSKNGFGKVNLVWNDANKNFREVLKESIEYILGLETFLESFETLDDVSNVFPPDAAPAEIARTGTSDRMLLAGLFGAHGNIDKALDEWVSMRDNEPTEGQKNRARDYLGRIESDRLSRDNVFALNSSLRLDGEALVKAEQPPESYPISSLIEWVSNGVFNLGAATKDVLVRLKDESHPEHKTWVMAVTGMATERDKLYYTAPHYPYKASVLVAGTKTQCKEHEVTSFASMLSAEFRSVLKSHADQNPFDEGGDYGTCETKLISEVSARKANLAASIVFGLPNFQRKTYQAYEQQLIDAMHRPRVRNSILNIARVLTIDELSAKSDHKILQGLRGIFADQIKRVRESVAAYGVSK